MGGLSFPTSVDFNSAGDAYVVINGVGAPGSGEVVKFAGLTAMEGSMMPAPAMPAADAAAPAMAEAPAAAEAPATLPQSGGELSSWPALALLVVGGILAAGGLLVRRQRG